VAHQEQLETLVDERTAELAAVNEELESQNEELTCINEELEQANVEIARAGAKAHEATQAKSDFLASMSHELRTPLNSIIGFSGVLLQGFAGELNEEQRHQLQMINDSGKHLLDLVNDVLDIAKVEAGKIRVTPEPIDLRALVADVCESIELRAKDKGLELRVRLDDAPDTIVTDRARLRQILTNLVDNAVRFSPAGGTVELKGEVLGDRVRVAVKDEGPGINEEDQQFIWERFYKADCARGGRFLGSGLGLAIARQIIDLHGGEIGVESTPGRGSTFWFTVSRA